MKALLSATTGALSIILTTPAIAGDQPQATARDPGTQDDIIVTADKRAEPASTVPLSISTATQADLQRTQIRDLIELQSIAPGLSVQQHQASAQTNFLIRGFGNGDNNAGIEPSVGIFIDGVYRSRSAASLSDLTDIKQVDVLEGPQSALFGKNASAGVIAISTQEPELKFGGTADATYSNRDGVLLHAKVTGPVTSNLAASVDARFNRRDGYVENVTTGHEINNRHRWGLRGQLLWTPDPNLKVRFIADIDRIDEACCAVFNLEPSAATGLVQAIGGNVNAPADAHANRYYSNFDPRNDIRNRGISAQVDYTLGQLQLTSITAWRKMRSHTEQDADFTSADLLGNYAEQVDSATFSQELRLTSNFDGPVNFVIGGYYLNERIRQAGEIDWGSDMRPYADGLIQAASANLGSPMTLSDVEQRLSALAGQDFNGAFFAQGQGQNQQYSLVDRSGSIFAHVDLKPTSRLTLTAGANFTRDVKHYAVSITSTDVFANLDLPGIANAAISGGVPVADSLGLVALMPLQYFPAVTPVPNAVETGRTADSNLSWTARTSYAVSSNVLAYANISRGFKPSSINLSRDSRPALSDAAALVAAGLAVPPTVDVAGLPISTNAYGSRYAGPETSTLFEAGVKTRFHNGNLSIAIFKETIKGFQSMIFTGTGFFLQNAGKVSNWGISARGHYSPITNFTVNGAIDWYHPSYGSFTNSSVGDLTGTRPANIPPVSIKLGGQLRVPLTDTRSLNFAATWRYESPTQIIEALPGLIVRDPITQAVLSNADALAAAERYKRTISEIDGSITYEFSRGFELALWVHNLANQRHLIGVIDTPAQSGSISGYANQPRNYGVTARLTW